MSVNAKLSQLAKAWKSVQPKSVSFQVVPDGEYVAKLISMTIEESRNSGRLQVVSVYEIVDGDYKGNTVKRFDGLDNDNSIAFFKGYCEILGLDLPDDITKLQKYMDKFVKSNNNLFNIVVKTKDKYANVYVNGVSELVEEDDISDEQSDSLDEDDVNESDAEDSEEELEEDEEADFEEDDYEEEDEEEYEEEPKPVSKPANKVNKKK